MRIFQLHHEIPQKSTPKKSRMNKGRPDTVEIVPASEDDAALKPANQQNPRGRPKKINTFSQTAGIANPEMQEQTKPEKQSADSIMIPDSAGEAKDVWVISSDDE